jgi:hypothetical protein
MMKIECIDYIIDDDDDDDDDDANPLVHSFKLKTLKITTSFYK